MSMSSRTVSVSRTMSISRTIVSSRRRKSHEMTGSCLHLVLSAALILLAADSILAEQWNREAIAQHSIGSCFNQDQKHLRMSCEPGHMVKLDRVFFGRGNQCNYTEGDCTLNVPEMEYYPCIGQQVCDINLPSGTYGSYMPKCDNYSNYMQAAYECIPEEEVTDICEQTIIRHKQWGYIKTPRYPTNYPDSQLCEQTVVAPGESQTIKVYIIDLSLEHNGTDCVDWLHLHDGFRSYTLCNKRSRHHVWTTQANELRLTFHSNYVGRRKGFWMHFEATPYIEPTTTPATTTGQVTTAGMVNKTAVDTADVSGDSLGGSNVHIGDHYYHISYSSEGGFPVGIVIGVVIGGVVCIMLVLLIVVVIKRREAAKAPAPVSCTSTTAFLEAKQAEAPSGVKCINNDLKSDRVPSYQEATASSFPKGKACGKPCVADTVSTCIEKSPTGNSPYMEESAPPYSEVARLSYVEGKSPAYSAAMGVQYMKGGAAPTGDGHGCEDRSPYIDCNMRTGEEQLYC